MSIKIVYRKDRDKWQVTYYEDGKRKRPLFATKQMAVGFARRLKSSHLGLGIEEDTITLSDAINEYFKNETQKKKAKESHATEKRYFNLLFHFLTEVSAIETVNQVSLQDLEAFQQWLLTQKSYDGRPLKMGPSTVNRAFNSIRHMFKKFAQWGYRSDSPCQYLDNLKAISKARRAMQPDEFKVAQAAAPEWFKTIFEFIYQTGAPPSCIERLTWDDVNFREKKFFFTRHKGGVIKRYPMPMTDESFAILVAIRNRSQSNHVFTNSKGRRLSADLCSEIGNQAIRDAGLKGVTLYGARHGLASDMTNAGVATEVIRQALGHASITTTQGYANKVKNEVLISALRTVRGGLVADKCHQTETPLPLGGREELEVSV